jgi:bifunctional non-homologous end joining protein LigD
MAARSAPALSAYRAKRDFTRTSEPPPGVAPSATAGLFVVQKHAARRLHWDFRLEHDGVLWSWAVPKGPSMDPHDKRLAVHVEDHPRDYADFSGSIPAGNYGAGTVEIWDRGTWAPVGDAAEGMRRGEIKFVLSGNRLRGHFVLVRLRRKPREKAENWLLIKEHDESERAQADAAALEATGAGQAPAPGAVRAALPDAQAPELATLEEKPPEGPDWISEVKFDGYRIMAWVRDGSVTLMTRNGQDWTGRLKRVARAVAALGHRSALLDGELVALRADGVSRFADLQAALAEGGDRDLFYYLFDLPYLDGWDLRACRLDDRKHLLHGLSGWRGTLRYSDHVAAEGGRLHRSACGMGLEGIVCKRVASPYRAGRGNDWVKVKCQGNEEFVVLGWTDPAGRRGGFGALHLGYYDDAGALHYAGGVGTGFSAAALADLRGRLDGLAAGPPQALLYAGDKPVRGLHWVRPELVVAVRFIGWSGAGRVRHASFLGVREDKPASQVVRAVPDAEQKRIDLFGRAVPRIVRAAAPRPAARQAAARHGGSVAAVARSADTFEGVRLTHGDRELWPDITKRDLAEYWRAVAAWALPGIAHRPLALVRCPDGIDGQHFFQKHAGAGTADGIVEGDAGGAPFLAIDGVEGLYGAAQMAAIELHSWGSSLADTLHPDRLVFDLDPGPGVGMAAIAAAARDVRARLLAAGYASWCRTSGGKGLHVVAPLVPAADWETARAWCRHFAEAMERAAPDRYVASVPKARRQGRILIDWLRNGLGSTAIASFSPRARTGAGVATPLDWKEVTARLDPGRFTLRTVPARLRRLKADPWAGFGAARQSLPQGDAGDGTARRRRV